MPLTAMFLKALDAWRESFKVSGRKSNARNYASPRVPLSLKERLKQELTRFEKEHVIIKEEVTKYWLSSLVVTEKPNEKPRVCIDPQHLNRALKRSHYPLPVTEGILPELTVVEVFSKARMVSCKYS